MVYGLIIAIALLLIAGCILFYIASERETMALKKITKQTFSPQQPNSSSKKSRPFEVDPKTQKIEKPQKDLPEFTFKENPEKEEQLKVMKETIFDTQDMSSESLRAMVQKSEKIQSPKVLLKKLSSSSYDPKEYAKIISNDPLIAARLLRMVNSAAFGLRDPITNIQHAIIYMGANVVKNLTMAILAQDLFSSDDKTVHEGYKKFWLAGFVASTLALKVSQHLNIENSSLLSTTTLLSCIGNIAFIYNYPEKANEYLEFGSLFERTRWEFELNQTCSAHVSGALAKTWELPNTLIEHITKVNDLMVQPPPKNPGPQYRESVLIYTCCRIGELFAFHDFHHLRDIDFNSLETLDFYYLSRHLQAAKLSGILDVLQWRNVNNDIGSIAQVLNG